MITSLELLFPILWYCCLDETIDPQKKHVISCDPGVDIVWSEFNVLGFFICFSCLFPHSCYPYCCAQLFL